MSRVLTTPGLPEYNIADGKLVLCEWAMLERAYSEASYIEAMAIQLTGNIVNYRELYNYFINQYRSNGGVKNTVAIKSGAIHCQAISLNS